MGANCESQAIQATHVVQIAAAAALQSEIQPLAPALAAIGARLRPPIFQAGPQVLVTEIDGFLLGLPSAEWRLGAYYALRGLPEPGLTRLFASLVQPGHIVVDAGAHIGIYSLYALRHLQGHGRLYSFEPTPATFALLRDNIQVNGFLESGVVHLDPRALSDRAALAPFTAFPANSGHNTLFPTGQPGESLKVQTVSLDEALAHEPRVDLVKIDAEGAEPLILRGMAALLARNPQIRVLVEFAPSHLRRAGLEPLQWFDDLQALGLLVQHVDDLTGELHPIDPAALANCFSWNLLLTRIQS